MNIKSVPLIGTLLLLGACHSSNEALSPPTISSTLARSDEGALSQRETDIIDAEVSVKAVDYATRHMTVRNFDGSENSFTVSPDVQRLNEVKPGDKIAVRFIRSLAFEVREPTAEEKANPAVVDIGAAKASLGLPPAAGGGAVMRALVTIDKIDLATNTVTIRTPAGEKSTLTARYPENLKRIKVGDSVVVSYGQAVAIGVEKRS